MDELARSVVSCRHQGVRSRQIDGADDVTLRFMPGYLNGSRSCSREEQGRAGLDVDKSGRLSMDGCFSSDGDDQVPTWEQS